MESSEKIIASTLVGTLLFVGSAAHALTAQEQCFLNEQKAFGAVAAAKLKCYAKAAKQALAVDAACLDKADAKLDAAITKAEADGPCGGDTGTIKYEYVSGLLAQVSSAITAPPPTCAAKKLAAVGKAITAAIKCYAGAVKKDVGTPPDCLQKAHDKLTAAIAKADQDAPCGGDASTLRAAVDVFVAAAASFPLVDNGDGTISDPTTGLMWEKKSNDGSVHDVDNIYTWTAVIDGTAADGTAFTSFLAELNTPPCFAGYCDWRLPSEDGAVPPALTGPRELETLRTCRYPNGEDIDYDAVCIPPTFNTTCPDGCTVTSCSCTAQSYDAYWSSTTDSGAAEFAWFVSFFNRESVTNGLKEGARPVRAVRP